MCKKKINQISRKNAVLFELVGKKISVFDFRLNNHMMMASDMSGQEMPLFVCAMFLGAFCRRLDGIHQCTPRHIKAIGIIKRRRVVVEISVLKGQNVWTSHT